MDRPANGLPEDLREHARLMCDIIAIAFQTDKTRIATLILARDLGAQLRKNWNIEFDDAQAIGRRYRRQDEIGTPFCITVDFDTLEDQAVTVRERDSMRQERIGIDQLQANVQAGGSANLTVRFVLERDKDMRWYIAE